MRPDEVHVLRVAEWPAGRWTAPPDLSVHDAGVDFPSMAPVVERMQAAFFGEEPDGPCVVAEVNLSPRQAVAGGRVPLDLPLPALCGRCGGRGEIWDERCPACRGRGERLVAGLVHVFVPSGVEDGAWFRFRVRAPAARPTSLDLRIRIR